MTWMIHSDTTLALAAKAYWQEPNPQYVALERRLKSAVRRKEEKKASAIRWQMERTEKVRRWWSESFSSISLPRGAREWLTRNGSPATYHLPPMNELAPPYEHPDGLTSYQREAVEYAHQQRDCVIVAPTGSGKTRIAIALMLRGICRTVIAVPTERLIEQWYEVLESVMFDQWYESKDDSIQTFGCLAVCRGAGWTVPKDVRTVLTTHRSLGMMADPSWLAGGRLIVDECHHAGAEVLSEAIQRVGQSAAAVVGLTATPRRQNETGIYLEALFGPSHVVRREEAMEAGRIVSADVVRVNLPAYSHANPAQNYSRAVKDLVGTNARNETIARAANLERTQGGVVLVLTDRVEHALKLHSICGDRVVTGEHDDGELPDEGGILMATTGVCGEGFDLPAISSVMLATPMRWEGKVMQAVGRALRPAPGKERARIIDFIDYHPIFQNQWFDRVRAYRKLGFRIL